jgi:hypothetical protein
VLDKVPHTDHDNDAQTPCVQVWRARCTLHSAHLNQCSAGTFVPLGSSGSCSKFACDFGLLDHDSDSSTVCEPCQAGLFGVHSLYYSHLQGTYLPLGSSGACDAFNCSAGTYDHDGSPASSCITCPSTSFQPSPGASVCIGATVCLEGTWEQTPATPLTDAVCVGWLVSFLWNLLISRKKALPIV